MSLRFSKCIIPPLLIILIALSGSTGLAQQSLYQEGKRLFNEGEIRRSIPYFEKTLQADSLHQPSYVFLSAAYLQTRQPTLALSTVDAGLRRFSSNLDLLWLRAEALLQQRRFLEARTSLETIRNKRSQGSSFQWLNISRQQIQSRLAHSWQIQGARLLQRGQPDSAAHAFQQALDFQSDSLQHYVNLAYANLQREEWDQALEVANRGLERFPDNGKLIKIKSRALYKKRNIAQLLEQYQRLHDKNPEDVEIALTYGQLLRADGQPKKAAKFFDKLIKQHPRDTRIYRALLQMNERSNNYRGKIEILKRMRKNLPEQQDTLTFDIGRTYEKLGEWNKARSAYDTLLTMQYDSLDIRRRIAETYRQQDSLTQAAAIYADLHRLHPENTDLMRHLGQIYEELDQWDQASTVYEQMIRQDTTNYGLIHLGMAYQRIGQSRKARKHFQNALRRGSSHPRPRLELSRMIWDKEPDRSFRLAAEALETSFRKLHEIQQQIRGQLKTSQGGLPSGNRDLRQNFEIYDELSRETYRYLTTQYKAERVLPLLQKLTGQYSESGQLHYLVGKYYEKQGKIDQAVQRYRKAIRENDEIREAHLALGRYYEDQGDIRKAIRSYENALTLDPKGPLPYGKLIDLYRKEGMLDRLCDRWKARYQSHVDNEVLREHLIEALHKADRFEEARKIVKESEE